MSEFYSRINKLGEKEFLKTHSELATTIIKKYTKKMGLEKTGEVLALFHDMGKRTNSFQERLFHNGEKVDHSYLGAKYLADKNKSFYKTSFIDSSKKINMPLEDLGIIIANHHTGLKNDRNFNKDYNYQSEDNVPFSIKNEKEYKKVCSWFEKNIGIIDKETADTVTAEFFTKFGRNVRDYNNYSKNSLMLTNRMLYSALIDADYTSSAFFSDIDYFAKSKGKKIDWDILNLQLEQYLSKITKKSKSNSELNKLRTLVYESCKKAGTLPTGNFTLNAPTGLGKTLATLRFALTHAEKYDKDRIFIVVPFLPISDQAASTCRNCFGEEIVLQNDSKTKYTEKTKILSENWDSQIIITTTVNFFETLFKYRSYDLRKLHNLTNSVIIFDEAQALPEDLLTTTFEAIDFLNRKFNVTTLFSTATLPAFEYRKKIKWTPTEIMDDPQKVFNRYAKVKKIKTNFIVSKPNDTKMSKSFTMDKIEKELSNKDSYLFIVNLKKQANQIYSNLIDKGTENIYYISTNLCSAHRTKVIEEINYRNEHNLPTKVISTQCLEAGVDLDFQYVYRTLAPLPSIIQRAGRCNRNAKTEGFLTVFELNPAEFGDETRPEFSMYPSEKYLSATRIVKYAFSKVGYNKIKLHSLECIKKYYHYLFNHPNFSDDSETLRNAILDEDYQKTDAEYNIIDQETYNVIVPYEGNMTLYDELVDTFKHNGNVITTKLMKKSSPIMVNVFSKKKFKENQHHFVELNFNNKGSETNWFYLKKDSNLYKNDTGLTL